MKGIQKPEQHKTLQTRFKLTAGLDKALDMQIQKGTTTTTNSTHICMHKHDQ